LLAVTYNYTSDARTQERPVSHIYVPIVTISVSLGHRESSGPVIGLLRNIPIAINDLL